MNQPHDPNVTSDLPSAHADFRRASDPLGTTDDVRRAAANEGSHPAANAPASVLPSVPGFRVLREIARGGMGKVLAAFDLCLDREVALKVLLPEANADRFVRESKITARLPHPGIPPVYALGRLEDGSPFLAMKLIAGQTLADEMKTADRSQLLQAFTQVCQAVGFVHSRGVIHRDLKPANVMVGAFGEVQVMDWGLAKDLACHEMVDLPRSSATLTEPTRSAGPNQTTYHQETGGESTDDRTHAGTVLGTPAYMAPEQARGEQVDARADVFALGGILCAILTGQPPFRGKSTLEVIQSAEAGDLAEANACLEACGADAELVALCRGCLSPNPKDRPADGQAVAEGITAYLNGVQERLQAAERGRAVAVAREAEQRKRRRMKLALVAAVLVLLLGCGAFAWYSDRQTTERRAEARNREQQANQGIDASLNLAPDLRKQYKFEVARKTLEQAAELAKGAAPDRLAKVEQALRDLAFVVQLDDVRYRKWVWIWEEVGGGSFNEKIAAPEYRRAFAERGLDLTALDPADAAERIAASAVKAELVAAVDDWALHESELRVRNRLLEIARRADPGAWTERLRDPALWDDPYAVEQLGKDADLARTSPATLSVLAELMKRRRLSPAPLLTAARSNYPADFELAFHLAQAHMEFKDGQPIGPLEAARALRPENVAVWANLSFTLYGKGQVDEAIACLRKAIAIDPKLALAHSNLGLALYGKRDLNEAIACYKKAIALDPKEAGAHIGLGNALYGKGQVDEAIACYHKAIALDGKDARAHDNLGFALQAKGQVDEAIACYQKAIEIDPKLANAHNNLGNVLREKDQVDDAIACFRKAIALDPKDAKAQYNLGNSLKDKGQVDEAITCFRKAIAIDPKLALAHSNLGTALDRKGQLDEAIACLRKAIALDPKFAGAHYNLGLVLHGKGQVDEAIACYQKAIAIDPKLALAQSNLGTALYGKGQVDEAIACYRKAIALDGKVAKAHIGLGNALYGKGQVDEAITCYRKAIALDGKDAKVHNNLGNAQQSKGQLDEAITCYRKAIEIDPKNASAQYNLGNVLADKGQVDEAIACYQKVIALDPKLAEAHCNQGGVLARQGRFAESLAAYKRGHALGTKRRGWPYPSAEWVRQAEAKAAMVEKLPGFLKGEFTPGDSQERLGLAAVCRAKKLHHTAVGLYAKAFAADAKLADDLKAEHRYNAASVAARAAAGQGEDATKLDDKERTRLRKQALDWLRADLALRTKQLTSWWPGEPASARAALAHWQKDADLAGIRDAAALAKLPAEEQKAFGQLWDDVAALLKKAQEKPQ